MCKCVMPVSFSKTGNPLLSPTPTFPLPRPPHIVLHRSSHVTKPSLASPRRPKTPQRRTPRRLARRRSSSPERPCSSDRTRQGRYCSPCRPSRSRRSTGCRPVAAASACVPDFGAGSRSRHRWPTCTIRIPYQRGFLEGKIGLFV